MDLANDGGSPLASCTCANLRKATRAITQLYDAALEPSGLLITQLSVLGGIATLKSATMNQLADSLVMDRTTLTRNLKPLLRRGLVNIASGGDERTRYVTLTSKGEHALSKALQLWENAQARVVKGLGEERWSGLMRNLSRLTEIAHQE